MGDLLAHCKMHILGSGSSVLFFLLLPIYSPYASAFEHAALFFAVLHVFSIRPLYIPRRGGLPGAMVELAPFSSDRMSAWQRHLADCGL